MKIQNIILCTSIALFPLSAVAEEYIEYSAPAAGSDAVTVLMGKEGLFNAHEDDCSASEEFIKMWDNVDGTDIGICVEEDERTAAEWSDARDTCVNADMRLPEPGEWKFACDNGTTLNTMTDDWEWSSNFAIHFFASGATPASGVAAPISGNGSCNYGSTDWASSVDGTVGSRVYRCVR